MESFVTIIIIAIPAFQNAHAYVNAAFCMEIDPDNLVVKGRPSFVYGGIDAHAVCQCSHQDA